MASNTVKFNVGGRHFEVSRALVDQHPDTMLAKLVSDAWQKNPEETVFIDRNGDSFAHVLDYLRYGSIELPFAISKSMFDRELDFYGINSVEGAVTATSIVQMTESLRRDLDHSKMKYDIFLLAVESHCQYCLKKTTTTNNVEVIIGRGHKVYDDTRPLNLDEKKLFESYLESHFGLKLYNGSGGSPPSRSRKFNVCSGELIVEKKEKTKKRERDSEYSSSDSYSRY